MKPTDDELNARLKDTLDRSVNGLDDIASARLASIRRAAQKHDIKHTHKRRIAAGVAVAASITAFLIFPPLWHRSLSAQMGRDVAYLSVEPEMLADMDMLQAIGENR